jgi:hypothetical protein
MMHSDSDKPLQAAELTEAEATPIVRRLLEENQKLREELQALRDEIARLKGGPPRPSIRASTLEKSGRDGPSSANKNRGQPKRRKTQKLEIHDDVVVPPAEPVPEGSRFKGYEYFTVQDLEVRAYNTRYCLARWETPEGRTLIGRPPDSLGGCHFGPQLQTYILHQYHHAHVTQPLLLEQLHEWGVEMSAGQLNKLITEPAEAFHEEKEALLGAGLQYSGSVNVDDTGARHQGRNGFCTHIGNEKFAFFASTARKSRINFLELLRAGGSSYVLNDKAFAYMSAQGLPQTPLADLMAVESPTLAGNKAWHATLERLDIHNKRHVRIATEGALLGAVTASGINPELVIISDDAGQFHVLDHALCWVHAERGIHKLVGFNGAQCAAIDWAHGEIRGVYQMLKDYKQAPGPEARAAIETRFEALCTTRTCFETLNRALKRLHANGPELLRVFDRPDIALHNNLAERAIRDYVKKRKVSGSTRSEAGRRSRDTFASLKKTCRKLGFSFWQYLGDRLTDTQAIPWLPGVVAAG